MVRDGTNLTIANKQKVMFLPSTGAIENIIHRDLDLLFQRHQIGNANIWKTVRAGKNARL